MKKLKKTKLLILDEWLLYLLKESEARDVLELLEARAKTASTIFCSQFDVPGRHYRHKRYVQMLQDKGIRQSMSHKGNCYDNAVM